MIKNVAIFILTGLLIGATFGVYLGTALDHPILVVALGTLGGIFLGWFIAAAVKENDIKKKNT